jgi:hypothetical protein
VRAEETQAGTQLASTCLSNHEHIEHTTRASLRHEIQESEGEKKQEAEGNQTDVHPNALENYDSQKPNDLRALSAGADEEEVLLDPVSKSQVMQAEKLEVHHDDPSFIVLTETKFSFRCIPVWDRYSPHRTRVEKKTHVIMLSP